MAAASVVAVRHVATVFAASPMVAVPLGMRTPLPRQHNWQVALAAEPALAEPEAETSEAAEVVATPTEAEADLQPEVLKNPALLFQELNISSKTEPKRLMKAMVAVFNRGERAVDLVLIDPRYKHTFIYALVIMPDNFKASAQVLVRRRDRRLRVRVIQHFVPPKDPEQPKVETIRVAKTANVTRIGTLLKNKFVDVIGTNLQRTVKLQFQGKETASLALISIENAGRLAYRELSFVPRFIELAVAPSPAADSEDGSEAADPPQTQKQIAIEVTVTAT